MMSEKATKLEKNRSPIFSDTFTFDVKKLWDIFSNFVAFSENINFKLDFYKKLGQKYALSFYDDMKLTLGMSMYYYTVCNCTVK